MWGKKANRIVVSIAIIVVAAAFGTAQARFGIPVNLGPNVNSAGPDGSPSVTADELELYFHSARPGGFGGLDIWVSTRESTSQPWGKAVNLGPVVNSSYAEAAPTVSSDGLELYFSDFSAPRPGGVGKTDIWVTTRASRHEPWTAPVNLGPTVNSAEDEITPVISANGLELIIDSYRPGGVGAADLWVARRDSKSAPWQAPEWLGPTLNKDGIEHCPTISADGLTLFFDYTPPGMAAEAGDLMVSRRASLSAPWGPPLDLGQSLSTHWASSISHDGKTLYFTSTRQGGLGGADIWAVPIELDSATIALNEAITSAFSLYARSLKNLDPVLFASLWDENGVKMLPDAPPILGKEAIRAFVVGKFALFNSRAMTISIDQVEGFGQIAMARGTYTSLDTLKSSQAGTVTNGWFTTVFRLQDDGSWKIYRDAMGAMPVKKGK